MAETEKTEPPTFKRQLVLLESIKQAQQDCQHSLYLPSNPKMIVCIECGALWIK